MDEHKRTRRVLARLRMCRMQMRREGKLALQGKPVNLKAANVRKTWELYGWVSPEAQREERKAA